jgi:hypothetical protein
MPAKTTESVRGKSAEFPAFEVKHSREKVSMTGEIKHRKSGVHDDTVRHRAPTARPEDKPSRIHGSPGRARCTPDQETSFSSDPHSPKLSHTALN